MIFKTHLGWAGLAVSDYGICRIVLPKKAQTSVQRELKGAECGVRRSRSGKATSPADLEKTVKLLRRYCSGERVLFDLKLDLSYYTDFQRMVWTAAREIPYGETRSYAWIAKRIGKPNAARAVGNALGANPIPVIIP